MQSMESTSDYALVSIDKNCEENSYAHPDMLEEMKELHQCARRSCLKTSPGDVALRALWMQEPVSRAMLYPGDAIYIPPGWWHSVRTWQPQEAAAAQRSMLLALEVLSCQHALVGLPEEHINKLLKKLGVQDDGEETFIAVD
ncbi:unnamed protein product [Symbiodinium natans]|uniref:JmjC domain-containing protein n=1 Tax=Symbiodinium natans TaxID=878477 RepID=A0A812R9C2_9DINO|nr:unnamed protein product [Symbiodinium natans]